MILNSVIALAAVGLVLAILLGIASILLMVKEDPRIEGIMEALPGANCGGCGYAGCEGYAVAVINNPEVSAGLCVVGGADLAKRIGELVGKAVTSNEPTVTFRRCVRDEGNVQPRYDYIGTKTCAGAALLEGGPYMCSWSCLGFGDCLRACPFDAMYIRNNLVEIDPSKCVSCGQCISVCPRSILQIIPVRARVMIYCSTREKLKAVSDICDVGCINCLKCLKSCPAEAIKYEKGRIEIDHTLCMNYGESCKTACVVACSRRIMRSCSRPTAQPEVGEHVVVPAQEQPQGSVEA